MGSSAASSQNINTNMVNNFPVAIGGLIVQGKIGNGATQQVSSASATGGTGSLSMSFGL
jgi:hypothetical protein